MWKSKKLKNQYQCSVIKNKSEDSKTDCAKPEEIEKIIKVESDEEQDQQFKKFIILLLLNNMFSEMHPPKK